MHNDKTTYHESAVRYNSELADFAEDLATRIEHEEVKRWSLSVMKQHRHHATRHQSALDKMNRPKQDESANEVVGTIEASPELSLAEEQAKFAASMEKVVHRSAETGEFVTEEFAKENPSITVSETVDIPSTDDVTTHNHADDGVSHEDCSACGTSSEVFQEAEVKA